MTADAVVRPNSSAHRVNVRALLERFGLVAVLVIMIVIFSILLPESFPTQINLKIALSSQAVTLMLALAVTFPLRAGDFDLSVSMVMVGSASVIAVLTTEHGVGLVPAMIVASTAAILVGAFNALLIVVAGVDSFIATLGMMTFLAGAIAGFTGGEAITGLPEGLMKLTGTEWGFLPSMVYISWGFAIVIWYIYEYTAFGRRLLFTGGNVEAARLAGIKVARVRALALIAASFLASIAGVLMAGGLGAVDPTSGHAYLLSPYAAAFLGMTVIQFRRFNVVGTVVGVYLLAVGVSGLQLLGVQAWVSDVFNGLMLLVAVLAATLLRRDWNVRAMRRRFRLRTHRATSAQPEVEANHVE